MLLMILYNHFQNGARNVNRDVWWASENCEMMAKDVTDVASSYIRLLIARISDDRRRSVNQKQQHA